MGAIEFDNTSTPAVPKLRFNIHASNHTAGVVGSHSDCTLDTLLGSSGTGAVKASCFGNVAGILNFTATALTLISCENLPAAASRGYSNKGQRPLRGHRHHQRMWIRTSKRTRSGKTRREGDGRPKFTGSRKVEARFPRLNLFDWNDYPPHGGLTLSSRSVNIRLSAKCVSSQKFCGLGSINIPRLCQDIRRSAAVQKPLIRTHVNSEQVAVSL